MEPSRIRAVVLVDRIEVGEKTVLIDTRNEKAWAESDQKLPGALRITADQIELHTHKLPRAIDCYLLLLTAGSFECPVRHED